MLNLSLYLKRQHSEVVPQNGQRFVETLSGLRGANNHQNLTDEKKKKTPYCLV